MHKYSLETQVLSTLMSYGVDRKVPELRVTEIKALMRNAFRVSNVIVDSKKMFQLESQYFGDATTQSSPITLQIIDAKEEKINRKRLLHVNKKSDRNNQSVNCFGEQTKFTLVVRGKNKLSDAKFQTYIDILRFSSYLGGIGQRSRRARGAISFEKELCEDKEQLLNFLHTMLEYFSPKMFNRKGNIIISSFRQKINRPVLEKIEIGEALTKSVENFLQQVDEAAHESRKFTGESGVFATGGDIKSGKFASSLMVSLVKTKDHKIYPIYVFLKPIHNREKIIDNREVFVNQLKGAKV